MKIIGILGGIASGKSLVAEQLAACGAKVLNADKIGHEVLEQPEIIAAVRERWGEGVFDSSGQVDRKRLAEIVFSPPPKGSLEREFLEHLTHPEIVRIIKDELAILVHKGVNAVVIDAALITELGLEQLCDTMVFVDSPRKLRLQRATARGWSNEDFAAREAAQKSLDFKRKQADFIIDNSGSPEETQMQVKHLWSTLIR